MFLVVETLKQLVVDPITHQVGDQEGRYVLTQDIDCAESANWTWNDISLDGTPTLITGFFPIMDPSLNSDPQAGFEGELDGAGFTVSNITQNADSFGGILKFSKVQQ